MKATWYLLGLGLVGGALAFAFASASSGGLPSPPTPKPKPPQPPDRTPTPEHSETGEAVVQFSDATPKIVLLGDVDGVQSLELTIEAEAETGTLLTLRGKIRLKRVGDGWEHSRWESLGGTQNVLDEVMIAGTRYGGGQAYQPTVSVVGDALRLRLDPRGHDWRQRWFVTWSWRAE